MKWTLCFGTMLAFALLTGCMHVDCVINEAYPETTDIKRYDLKEKIPYQYKVIGTCQASGNYSDFSLDDMLRRLVQCGETNGADAVVILGMRVAPTGTRVVTDSGLTSLEATSSATSNTWEEMGRDFQGGYGNIRKNNPGTAVTYTRTVRAELIKYIFGEDGNPLPNEEKNTPVPLPLESMKELKTENKIQSAQEQK